MSKPATEFQEHKRKCGHWIKRGKTESPGCYSSQDDSWDTAAWKFRLRGWKLTSWPWVCLHSLRDLFWCCFTYSGLILPRIIWIPHFFWPHSFSTPVSLTSGIKEVWRTLSSLLSLFSSRNSPLQNTSKRLSTLSGRIPNQKDRQEGKEIVLHCVSITGVQIGI